jgi:aminoglycoside phosphotransferase (APT) family kinase protein
VNEPDLAPLRGVIVQAFPDLAASAFTLLREGWDSVAVDVDDRLILKFPRHERARISLLREASLLRLVRPAVSMPVPDLAIIDGPGLFSRHDKLKGDHLTTDVYDGLPEDARRRLGDELARFYAQLHRLDPQTMMAAGAAAIGAWLTPRQMRERALPALPPTVRPGAERTIAAFEALPADPLGQTYGFFDGHGWNMAFDAGAGVLSGVYDFADSGLGGLHQEFVYANMISPDLTARIIAGYETLTGRPLDRRRIAVLYGALCLSELAELPADDHRHAAALAKAIAWLEAERL